VLAMKDLMDFGEKFLEDSRRFMLSDEKKHYLFKFFGIRPGQRILDVGCGTGYFSREMAKFMNNIGEIVGIDINPNLIKSAKQICGDEKISIINYIEENALRLKFTDGVFDATICYFLLSRLKGNEPFSVLDEMIRVTKHGGQIMAFEPILGAISARYPAIPRLSSLLTRIRYAKTLIQKDLYEIDENIGEKLQQVFIDKGLINVEVEIFATLWYSHLPFYLDEMNDDLKSWYSRRLVSLQKPDDQNILEMFGNVGSAALGLRPNSKDYKKKVILDLYKSYGVGKDDLLECNQLRINFLEDIINRRVLGGYVNGMEIMPVYAVKGQKC